MSQISYQRLLRARCSQLAGQGIAPERAAALDEILSLPHPQREIAFVGWWRQLSGVQAASSQAFRGDLMEHLH